MNINLLTKNTAIYHQKFEKFYKEIRQFEMDEGLLKNPMENEQIIKFAEKNNVNGSLKQGVVYTTSQAFLRSRNTFTVTRNVGLNKTDNSISLVPGMSIRLSNGISLKIGNNLVHTKFDNITSSHDGMEANSIAHSLEKFIRYANGEYGASGFGNEDREVTLDILNILGIDTSKEFIVNGTKFNTIDHGRLEMSGVINSSFTYLPAYKMKQLFDSYGLEFDWGD